MSNDVSDDLPGDVPSRRTGVQWPMLIGLTIVWVLLWGGLTVTNVLSGLVVAVVVTLVFPLPPIVFGGKLRPRGLAVLIGWFVVELFVASVEVAVQALRPGKQPPNAVIEADLRSHSDLYLTLTAELLSLVPGSLVVEARRSTSTLFLHVLGVRDAEDVEKARRRALRQEERVMLALASDEELAAYRAEVEASR
ncbi:Na+/H+ antiporter subunit E [Jiangella sp. DSM 45060]|uniref:Na+/H+ antiporter subunit E n=1 Tax=Jiangella sp. DSM 45060 TaxID=1798224 RepID=UPI00087BE0DD|nr:Na+/H+ antiporter subunit E [Jiangella sp. DSM 45060]SDS92368.1 multisubunit sodium/proton antiporter, MrpE subunit [Jiangella sp. DSM 45060]